MASYTQCRLTIGGDVAHLAETPLDENHPLMAVADAIVDLDPDISEMEEWLEEDVPEDESSDPTWVAQRLLAMARSPTALDGPIVLDIPEVKYGDMPDALHEALTHAQLSYVWESDDCDGHGQSTLMYDPKRGTVAYPMSEWEMCLPMEGVTLAKFAQALQWHQWYRSLTLYDGSVHTPKTLPDALAEVPA